MFTGRKFSLIKYKINFVNASCSINLIRETDSNVSFKGHNWKFCELVIKQNISDSLLLEQAFFFSHFIEFNLSNDQETWN